MKRPDRHCSPATSLGGCIVAPPARATTAIAIPVTWSHLVVVPPYRGQRWPAPRLGS